MPVSAVCGPSLILWSPVAFQEEVLAATFTPAKFGPVGTHSRIWGVNGRTSSPRVLSVSGWAFGSASRPAGSSADGAGAGAKDGGGGTCHARAHKCVPDEVGAR